MRTVLHNCTIIDCTGNPPLKDMMLVVEGEAIADLREGPERRSDSHIVRL